MEKKQVQQSDQYIGFSMAVARLPAVSLQNPRGVRTRIARYFQLCEQWDRKPSVSGLALSLNIDRRQFLDICAGTDGAETLPRACVEQLRKARRSLELLWEQYVLEGRIGATPGIFLGKNQFSYQDRAELAVTSVRGVEDCLSVEELATRARRLQAGLAADEE